MNMFCYQCQEASKGTGCTLVGVCGKTPEVSGLQDLLIYQLKGISQFSIRLRALNIEMPEVNKFVTDSLFMTITNANFDYDRFVNKIIEGFELRDKAKSLLIENGGEVPTSACDCLTWKTTDPKEIIDNLIKKSINKSMKTVQTFGLTAHRRSRNAINEKIRRK